MNARTAVIHPEQWAGDVTSDQAGSYYERHQDLAMVAVTALFSDPSVDTQAAALVAVAEAEMGMAAVAWIVYCDPSDGGASDLTPTQRAEQVSEHIDSARVALRLAEAARSKVHGLQRPRAAWPELEAVAGPVLDGLADPAVTSAARMADLYERLVPLVVEVDGHADFVQQMATVWRQHATNESSRD